MNEVRAHLDGCSRDPKESPKSNDGKCPNCRRELHGHYGLAGGFGLGVQLLCLNPDCDNDEMYDFRPDLE